MPCYALFQLDPYLLWGVYDTEMEAVNNGICLLLWNFVVLHNGVEIHRAELGKKQNVHWIKEGF